MYGCARERARGTLACAHGAKMWLCLCGCAYVAVLMAVLMWLCMGGVAYHLVRVGEALGRPACPLLGFTALPRLRLTQRRELCMQAIDRLTTLLLLNASRLRIEGEV